jgi:hypothetical protein
MATYAQLTAHYGSIKGLNVMFGTLGLSVHVTVLPVSHVPARVRTVTGAAGMAYPEGL